MAPDLEALVHLVPHLLDLCLPLQADQGAGGGRERRRLAQAAAGALGRLALDDGAAVGQQCHGAEAASLALAFLRAVRLHDTSVALRQHLGDEQVLVALGVLLEEHGAGRLADDRRLLVHADLCGLERLCIIRLVLEFAGTAQPSERRLLPVGLVDNALLGGSEPLGLLLGGHNIHDWSAEDPRRVAAGGALGRLLRCLDERREFSESLVEAHVTLGDERAADAADYDAGARVLHALTDRLLRHCVHPDEVHGRWRLRDLVLGDV